MLREKGKEMAQKILYKNQYSKEQLFFKKIMHRMQETVGKNPYNFFIPQKTHADLNLHFSASSIDEHNSRVVNALD